MPWPQWLSQTCILVFLIICLFPEELTTVAPDKSDESVTNFILLRQLGLSPSPISSTPSVRVPPVNSPLVMAPYLCVPACVAGPWPSKRSATLHRNSCMLWQEHIETQATKRHHSPSSNDSASGSDKDVATIRAMTRRKKKARLAKKPDTVTFHVSEAVASSVAGSSQVRMHDSEDHDFQVNVPVQTPSQAQSTSSIHTAGADEPNEPSLHSDRPRRNRRLPVRYQDVLPEGTAAIINSEPHPSHDPDGEVGMEDMANIPSLQDPDEDGHMSDSDLNDDTTLNPTQTLLTGWQNNGNSTKSNGEMDKLANLIRRPEFQVSELQGYSAQTANARITQADENWDYNKLKDSFLETSVDIEVPSGDKNIPSKVFSILGLLYRSPLSVIRASFASRLANRFHYTPFRLFQTSESPDGLDNDVQRVHTDIYNSDAFIQEHYRVLRAPTDDPNCKREKVVAALMCWSDATQLANFGTAKLWPIYMLFGNLSKYIQASPNSGATQSKEIITHCSRELYHAIWRFLLDDEFIHAYRYGIVIKCFDGVEHRIYPRFFTYSADYPEKVLLAAIREQGLCVCPRCLCPKTLLDQMGTHRDFKLRMKKLRNFLVDKVTTAREYIYRKGYGIRSVYVEGLLKATSSVPTMNAFVERLGVDFDISCMLAPEFMHEFELGVFKALFAHLIRVLYARDSRLIELLDHRFRQIPTFGFDTIHLFANNASEMKRLAARDFEDLLQASTSDINKCAIPVFEGLLEGDDNKMLMKLLYQTVEWHALAKLRMHTEQTLNYMETCTQEFGKLMRNFRDLSQKYNTRETDREMTAHYRRTAEQAKKSSGDQTSVPPLIAPGARRKKTLNLFTYKWHALMDYVWFIRWFGPSDIYSTQLGELAHRVVKRLYGLGNKKHDHKQIGRRLRRVEWAKRAFDRRGIHTKWRRQQAVINKGDSITTHYHIGKSSKNRYDLKSYTHSGDPAAKDFWPKLQDHLLGRLMQREFDGDTHEAFTNDDRKCIRLRDRKLFELQTLRVNYTTYDVRRDQDSINPRNHADVMVLSPEDEPGAHPYCTSHTGPREMELLWVRWLGVEPGYRSGHQYGHLPKVGFVDEADPFAFGFLDPAHVIRGCHLMPSFSDGRTSGLLQTSEPTVARKKGEVDDWQFFYVGIFVDRDMYMRYFPGGGIGHTANRKFFKDMADSEDGENEPDGEIQPGNQSEADEDDELYFDSELPLLDKEDLLGIGSDEDNEDNEDDEDEEDAEENQDSLDGTDIDDWQWDDGYGSA
ncbi:hypothetical protein F5876DRAFT_77388 [Lentinula aff. lateritia]|uniref:Uncharacterized protein n=1 Tax=Lentinula aff. lateritia TaxID=2804960 RepID=A0ACC1TYG6_9AGAR|nr:hypothetical protein F5876DRAFT_77388 [Lentinula aff. lateritia]